ncbi:MAG: hypothetical protein QOH70_1941 [Blastocatellia bacterium]|nr:hypothetical protein [Blastocatellia bacterium]
MATPVKSATALDGGDSTSAPRLRAVIGQAMSVLEEAIEAFEVEIQKLDSAPTV